jgi:hypothetical protein
MTSAPPPLLQACLLTSFLRMRRPNSDVAFLIKDRTPGGRQAQCPLVGCPGKQGWLSQGGKTKINVDLATIVT